MLTIDEITSAVGGRLSGEASRGAEVTSVVVDSRQATPGALFVAFRGQKHDGHDFVLEAFAKGARVAMVERVPRAVLSISEPGSLPLIEVGNSLAALHDLAGYWRSKLSPRVVAVTGSVGKTTTKEVIASVLGDRLRVARSEGNLNTEIGMPLMLLRATPRDEVLVVEMGMYALGEIRTLAQLARPDIGIVTNVGPTHLERLGSLENIALAKRELVEELPRDGVAVLNFDDPRVRAMSAACKGRVVYYGLEAAADFWATNPVSRGLRGIEFDLHHGGEQVHVRTLLLGLHSVHAALAASAVAHQFGMSLDETAAALHEVSPTLRLIVESGINGSTLIDDSYNASPASTLAALNLLTELEGRKVAVLGDMRELGTYSEEGHRLVGRRAADVVEVLVAVGALGSIIGQEALALGKDPKSVFIAPTNDEAVQQLTSVLRPGDVVLIKGSRGMQMETIVEALRWPTR